MLRVLPYPPPRMMSGNGTNGSEGNNTYKPINLFHNSPLHPHHNQRPMMVAQQQQQAPKQPEVKLPTPSEISQTYKTCTLLFLTRRLPEALAMLQTILYPVASVKVGCLRSLRIKTWSLYFAILDAAAKMGSEEGKTVFDGMQEWKKVVGKVRSGSVWEECLNAFGGEEGRMDGDIVIALTMLLLTHSHDHFDTQKKIEAYMSANSSLMSLEADADPRLLAQRIKLIELYVLHVLPKVEQWDYAREFTSGSNDLGEDQKEQFLSTLEALLVEKKAAEEHARQLERQRELDLEAEREEIERRAKPVRRERSPSVAGSVRSTHSRASRRKRSPESVAVRASSRQGSLRGRPSTPKGPEEYSSETDGAITRRAMSNSATNSVFATTSTMLNKLQTTLFNANGPLAGGKNTSLLLRTVIMVFAVVWAGSKKKVRERLRRWFLEAWKRIIRTVGMGVRVTYI